MADMFTPERRSEIMSHIRSTGTSPEKLVFGYLRKQGIYFQKHYKRAPGKPDIALPRKKIAVFIHGDFWHGYDIENARARFADKPYWLNKIEGNRKRDELHISKLQEAGWKVLVVWQHDLLVRNRQETFDRIVAHLCSPS